MRYFITATFIFFLTGWFNIEAQVDFFAGKTVSCGPTDISFNLVAGGMTINKVRWDFGNGRTSTLQNPTVSYPDPGIYTVKVTVNDTLVITKTNLIKIVTPPIASFNFRDSMAVDSFIFIFTSAKQPIDSLVYTYHWQLSDTSSATTANLIHTFPREGTYLVNLKVSDNMGCTDSLTQSVVASRALVVPNVITPNNDGINDVLIIQTDGKHHYVFRVYSTTGILVFEANGSAILWKVWEGQTSSGVFLNSGVFYYTLECTDPGVVIKRQSGFIYLFK